jgi:hypothetical protein
VNRRRWAWLLGVLSGAVMLPLFLAACSGEEGKAPAASPSTHLMLLFQEQEPDVDPYTTRVIVTDNYMRMDDGKGARDFVLFDRRDRTIYSVSYDNRATLVIHHKRIKVDSPIPLTIDARKVAHPDAPPVGGHKPVQYDLLVNGKSCTKLVAVPGLLQGALKAMREFRRALAGQHAENLSKTPVDMLDPCFVADAVFAPVRVLQYGFPIRQWDANGKKRTLVDYDTDFKVDPSLFRLPKGFRIEEMGPHGVTSAPNA